MLQCMIKLVIGKAVPRIPDRTAHIPVSYNDSTKDSDSFGGGLIPSTGAIPLSITVSTAGSNPAGVGSTPNRGCQGNTVGNRM